MNVITPRLLLTDIKRAISLLISAILVLTLTSNSYAQDKQEQIDWQWSYKKAIKVAEKDNKLLLLNFFADWCPHCKHMDKSTYLDPQVIAAMKQLVSVKIDVDKQKKLAREFDGTPRSYGGSGIPAIMIIKPDGTVIAKMHGYLSTQEILKLINSSTE